MIRARLSFLLELAEQLELRPIHPAVRLALKRLLLSLGLVLGGLSTVAAAESLKGHRYPAENKRYIAPESGLEVIQVTTSPADDSGLYFTSHSFAAGGESLIFESKRTGHWNLFRVDLRSFEITQLTDSPTIRGVCADVSAQANEAYYFEARQLKAVNLTTLEERVITEIPQGYGAGASVSAMPSGPVLAFSISQNLVLPSRTEVLYSDLNERFEKKPWSAVLTGNADGTGWHEIVRQAKWISHTLISPTNPRLVLYCHEGPWERVEQRMWLAQTDGQNSRALRREERADIRIGHEFWFEDGIHVGYQLSVPHQPQSIGIADARDGTFVEYPVSYYDTHVQANQRGDAFVGDGNAKDPCINFYRLENGTLKGERLVKHLGSFAQQYWHPHPAFSPDGGYILYTSTNAGGTGDVFLIQTPKKKNGAQNGLTPSR